MNRVWTLVTILFLCDLAMPLSPGVFQFDPEQSLEIARRVSIQTASAQLPPLPHRFPASAQPAPRPSERAAALSREATSPRTFVPLARSPQHEVEALNSADPA